MTRARILIDIINKYREYIIKPGESKSVGRGHTSKGKLCDIITLDPEKKEESDNTQYRKVSRHHLDIYHEVGGIVYIISRSKTQQTYFKEKEDSIWEAIQGRKTFHKGKDYFLKLGENYIFKLEERDIDSEKRKDEKRRLEDTQHDLLDFNN